MKKYLIIILILLSVNYAKAGGLAIWCESNSCLYLDYTPGIKDFSEGDYYRGYRITKIFTWSGASWIFDDSLKEEITSIEFITNTSLNSPPVRIGDTSLSGWFMDLPNLESIEGFGGITTPNATDMSNMFSGCRKLTSVNLNSLDTSKVTDMHSMFSGCSSLTNIELSCFDTSKVTNMHSMFSGCSSLTDIELSSFDTSNVTDMHSMFSGCSKLTNVELNGFNTSLVTNMSNMFDGCRSITNIEVNGFSTHNVTNMSAMFSGCKGITSLNLSNYDTSKVTNMSALFSDCSGLTSVDLSMFDTSNVKDMSAMFSGCSRLTSINLSNFDTSNAKDMSAMFSDCSGIWSLNLRSFDMSKVTNINSMFKGCSRIKSLNMNTLDTSKVTDMGALFSGCSGLTSLDLSYFNTSLVTNMDAMFYDCSGLTSLDVSFFDTSKVTNMNSMFKGCCSLIIIDLYNFDTSNVTSMKGMFENCTSLTNINVSGFNTIKIESMNSMFENCSSLKRILCNFTFGNSINANRMFCGCGNLETIYAEGSWDCISSDRMFYGCYNLSGALSYNSNRLNAKYANNSGYFSYLKTNYSTFVGTSVESWHAMSFAQPQYTPYVLIDDGRPSKMVECNFSTTANTGEIMFQTVNGLENGDYEVQVYANSYYTPNQGFESDINEGDCTLSYVYANDRHKYLTTHIGNSFDEGNIYTIYAPVVDGKLRIGLVAERPGANWYTIQIKSVRLLKSEVVVYADNLSKTEGEPNPQFSYIIHGTSTYQGSPVLTCNATEMSPEGSYVIDINTDDMSCDKPIYKQTGVLTVVAPQIQVVWCKGNSTLYFFTDKEKYQSSNLYKGQYISSIWGINDSAFSEEGYPKWHQEVKDDVKNVVFESNFNLAKLKNLSFWFRDCTKLSSISGLENLNTSNVTDLQYMFYNCKELTNIDLSNFNTSNVVNMKSMFSGCVNLTDLDLSGFNTSSVTDMSSLFSGCVNLTNIDLSGLNTSNVTDMNSMFFGCRGLNNLNLNGIKTYRVTDMNSMFYNCRNLKSIDTSGFDTSNVISMYRMFLGCASLANLDIRNFNTSKVENMGAMFYGCNGITNLDIKHFDTSKVTNMNSMFSGCSNLTFLNLNNFETSKAIDMASMFARCSSLEKIYCNNSWSCNISDDMFYGCTGLTGAISYDATKTDIYYANPTTGYFTFYSSNIGDVNEDGDINVFDIVEMIDYIMQSTYVKTADLVTDGVIDVFDLVEAVSIVMQQTASSPKRRVQAQGHKIPKCDLHLLSDDNLTFSLGGELEDEIVAYQLTLELADGLSLKLLTTDDDHALTFRPVGLNRYKVLCYSDSNTPIEDNNSLLNIQVEGKGTVIISDVLAVTESREHLLMEVKTSLIATNINNVTNTSDMPLNVYSVTGNIIRKNADSLNNLPKGTYIVNGKKILVK